MRALLVALPLLAAGAPCRLNSSSTCPASSGSACTSSVLCSTGSCLYTASSASGQGVRSYSGTCSTRALSFNDVYSKPCDPAGQLQCQYIDALGVSPYGSSALQCAPSPGSSNTYSCLLGPNKAGDACFYNSECASGICSSRGNGEGDIGTNTCVGISAGGTCSLPSATRPDPCAAGQFCSPSTLTCSPVARVGAPCTALAGCERGAACSSGVCARYMAAPVDSTNAAGPYMCASGTALQVSTSPPTYQCVNANATLPKTGRPCNPGDKVDPGMECACAASGVTLTRPVGGYGLGFNSRAYTDLNTCLLGAKSPMNFPCHYDYSDFERIRYGSCAYYACFAYYKTLVNGTGGRFFTEPLAQFSTAAPCEQPTLAAYFRNLLSTPCIRISNLENWKCFNGASNAPTIGATQAIVTLIILAWFGAYWYHMKLYGGHGLDLLVPLVKDVPVLGPFLVKHFGSPGGSSGAVELK